MNYLKQKKIKAKSFFAFITAAIITVSYTFAFADNDDLKSNSNQSDNELNDSGLYDNVSSKGAITLDKSYDNILSRGAISLDKSYDNVLSKGAIVLDIDESSMLVPNIMDKKDVIQNPYMGSLDASIHNDNYSTDVINSVAPLGIYPEVAFGMEPDSYNATPNAYYDDRKQAVAAYQGGVAIKKLAKDKVEVLGSFIPSKDEGIPYSVQTSYSFVDSNGHIVFPTSHGHIAIAQTTDSNGNVLKVFKKLMDVDVVSEAKRVLGDDIDPNILSIIYDYKGNLWFVSGGFRKNPEFSKDGFIGYLSRSYIDSALNGKNPNLSSNIFFRKLTEGEGAENGISSSPEGVVILTNKSCYLLKDNNGVNINWKVDYNSVSKKPIEGSNVTGIGLAWGGGSTPTLTNDLVLFTDNCSPINLIAISLKSGQIVAQMPILDSLPETEQVSVENSILVYSSSEDKASVVICNWFGAGNSALDSPDADSSIQTYDNVYDANWMRDGNKYLSPGVERVDVVKDANGWHMEKVWIREDIRDTAMLKLSTSTGYLYGYWQNMDTDYWAYYILDFGTGETKLEVPISNDPKYNNMAVGMINDINGNALYCPTNNKVLLRLQDRFVYLPKHKDIKLDLGETERKNISKEEFLDDFGVDLTPATYLNTAVYQSMEQVNTVAFRVNGIDNMPLSKLKLYAVNKNENINLVSNDNWQITDKSGRKIEEDEILVPKKIYEIRFDSSDQDEFDLCDETGKIKVSVVLGIDDNSQMTENTTEITTENIIETTTEGTTETTTETERKTSSGGGGGSSSYKASGNIKSKEKNEDIAKNEDITKNEDAAKDKVKIKDNDTLKETLKRSNIFRDVPDNTWYSDSVEYVYKNGIFSGISDTLFAPDMELTRGMAVAVLGRIENIDTSDYTNMSYSDVNPSAYYAPYIEWAAQNNIVASYGNGIFKPDESITREQISLIIKNYIAYKGGDTSTDMELLFDDTSLISQWAEEGVKCCVKNGIILGDNQNMFNPKKYVSRAEFAAIITRIITSSNQ